MNQSQVILKKDGTLEILLANQTEMSERERLEIVSLHTQSAQFAVAELNFKKEIAKLEASLLGNELYSLLLKYKEKLKIARAMKRDVEVVLANEVGKLFKNNGSSPAEYYAAALPEPKSNRGKRGRPRLVDRIKGNDDE